MCSSDLLTSSATPRTFPERTEPRNPQRLNALNFRFHDVVRLGGRRFPPWTATPPDSSASRVTSLRPARVSCPKPRSSMVRPQRPSPLGILISSYSRQSLYKMIVFLDVIRLDTVTAPMRTPSQRPVNNYEGIIIMTTTGENARPLPLTTSRARRA